MDGYGNKSKFEFVPITFDVFSNGATTGGSFPDYGSQYFSTLGLVGSTLKSAQLPPNPTLEKLTFKYWYKSTDSTKTGVTLTSAKVTGPVTYYPLWEYPTVTISNTVTGSAGNAENRLYKMQKHRVTKGKCSLYDIKEMETP